MLNRDRPILKVDGIPLEAQHLAPAKPIERGQLHRRFDDQSLHTVEQTIDFILVVEAGQEAVLLGPVDFVRRIRQKQVSLDRVLERSVDDGVIVNHGVGADAPQLRRVKVLMCLAVSFFSVMPRFWNQGNMGLRSIPK